MAQVIGLKLKTWQNGAKAAFVDVNLKKKKRIMLVQKSDVCFVETTEWKTFDEFKQNAFMVWKVVTSEGEDWMKCSAFMKQKPCLSTVNEKGADQLKNVSAIYHVTV